MKKQGIRRVGAAVIISAMLAGSVAGCGQAEVKPDTAAEEPGKEQEEKPETAEAGTADVEGRQEEGNPQAEAVQEKKDREALYKAALDAYDGIPTQEEMESFNSMFTTNAMPAFGNAGMSAERNGGIDLSGIASLFSAPAEEAESADAYEGQVADVAEEAAGDVPAGGYEWNTSEFSAINENGFKSVKNDPLSTFAADADTASYCIWRQALMGPIKARMDETAYGEYTGYGLDDIRNSMRKEEFINYFHYNHEDPEEGEMFGVTSEVSACPWDNETELLYIGVKAKEMEVKEVKSNIVLLVDTSGSMFEPNKLPLAIKSIKELVKNFDEKDTISLVTYAGNDDILFEGYTGKDTEKIHAALENLEAYGSTNGAAGLNTAYELAEKYLIKDGNNRVILMTDGDFNVGVSSEAGLIDLIKEKKETGVFFSACGFGTDTYSDTRMEAMADSGNGNYDYIDSSKEAEKFFTKEFASTIYTVAKDVKFQVDFNPELVAAYRQVGYENRQVADEDFANDAVDGGEVGSEQCVTVLYEIIPVGAPAAEKYMETGSSYTQVSGTGNTEDYATVRIRYKEPDEEKSKLQEKAVTVEAEEKDPGDDLRWAAGVAWMVQLEREKMDVTPAYEYLAEKDSFLEDPYKVELLAMLKNHPKDI